MTYTLKELTNSGDNHFRINSQRKFGESNKIALQTQELSDILDFCYKMTHECLGEHRKHRTGGKETRIKSQIFIDIFIGKVGEVVFYNTCKKRPTVKHISNIDFAPQPLGYWDNSDFIVTNLANQEHKIAIKTAKHFSNLLLLEANDWEVENGVAIYIPNREKTNEGIYDFFFFCRVNFSQLLERVLQQSDSISISPQQITPIVGDVVGYLNNATLVEVIENKHILPQGSTLGKGSIMDATNYYIQSGCLKLFKLRKTLQI